MALIRQYGHWVFFLSSLLIYVLFAFEIQRTDHLLLIGGFLVLTILAVAIQKSLKQSGWIVLFAFGLLFRLAFLWSTPHFSNDFYRYTWDGELMKDGYEVFGFVPKHYAKHVSKKDQKKYERLFNASSDEFPVGMNSKNYYSIYPTVNQMVFVSAAFTNAPNDGNLVVIRLWIIIAEIASFFILRALLTRKNKTDHLALFWLHPLIIIELTGNLHFEGIAITFILLAIFFAERNRIVATAFSTALAIMTKLTPLFLLGAFFRKFSFKQWIAVCSLTAVFTAALFLLVVDAETFLNFKKSFGLYFAWFSFNAGLFYGVRDFAYLISGSDISSWISLLFPFISMGFMAYIVLLKKYSVEVTLLLLFTVYFIFSPIVHPWYITVLIPLGILSEKIFPLLWSILIVGSYSAFGAQEFSQPLWFYYLEYAIVIFTLFAEFRLRENWSHRIARFIYG